MRLWSKSSEKRWLSHFCARGRSFAISVANTRANIAIIFALSAIPVVAAIGCVVDYSYASMIKTKLQAAADAAALATVSNNSPIVVTAKVHERQRNRFRRTDLHPEFLRCRHHRLFGRDRHRQHHQERNDGYRNIELFLQCTDDVYEGSRLSEHSALGLVHGERYAGDLHQLLSDARRLRLHELPLHHCGAGEADVGQSRQPASYKQPAQQRLSARLPVRLPLGDAEHRLPEHHEPANQYTRPVARILAPSPTAIPQRGLPDFQSMAERLSRRLLHGIFDKPSRNYAGVSDELRSRQ